MANPNPQAQQTQNPPDTLPADFFSQSQSQVPNTSAPETLPADFFSKQAETADATSQPTAPALPNGEMHAAQAPNVLKNPAGYAQDVSDDIRYGTDKTIVGSILKGMGAKGVDIGNPDAVGEFMGSLPLGVLQTLKGVAEAHEHPWQGTKDIAGGALQASTMPGAFMSPEVGEAAAKGGAKTVEAAIDAAGAVKSKVLQPFDTRPIQKTLQAGLRDFMDDVAAEAKLVPAQGAKAQPVQSIRTTVQQVADGINVRARQLYANLDAASGGQIQRFDNALRDVNIELRQLVGTEDEASEAKEATLLSKKASIEQAQSVAFDKMKQSGIDPTLVDNARNDFKQSQALYDLDYNVKKATTGTRPDIGATLKAITKDPELVDPKKLSLRLNNLYDSGRLQEAVGEDKAKEFLNTVAEQKINHQDVLNRQKWLWRTIKAAGVTYGVDKVLPGGITHIFSPGIGITPVQ